MMMTYNNIKNKKEIFIFYHFNCFFIVPIYLVTDALKVTLVVELELIDILSSNLSYFFTYSIYACVLCIFTTIQKIFVRTAHSE